MYHASDAVPAWLSGYGGNLAITPSVAMRNLYEQLTTYLARPRNHDPLDVYFHFVGPIRPPLRHARRPIGDRVFDAVAEYATAVVGKAGLLTTSAQKRADVGSVPDLAGRFDRCLDTLEHALAVDLQRMAPNTSFSARKLQARSVLSLAAFWCDRSELLRPSDLHAHPLLGARPQDLFGAALYAHALEALSGLKAVDVRATELRPVELFAR